MGRLLSLQSNGQMEPHGGFMAHFNLHIFNNLQLQVLDPANFHRPNVTEKNIVFLPCAKTCSFPNLARDETVELSEGQLGELHRSLLGCLGAIVAGNRGDHADQ